MYYKKEIDYEDVPQLSERDKTYQQNPASLNQFFRYLPVIDSFDEVIRTRKAYSTDRQLLTDEIRRQYEKAGMSAAVKHNIDLLERGDTFTIITAHQPVLLTGPLYFIFKIAGVLSLSAQLNNRYEDVNVVPVFILGGEDHDFDEIASVHLFNKTFTWESIQKGAVGRMSLDDLKPTLEEILERFGTSPFAVQLEELIRKAYSEAHNYGDFTFRLINELFKDHGLVVVNMDNRPLKSAFLPLVVKDLQELISHRTVNHDQKELEKIGFKSQALAREVNLFYHGEDRMLIMRTDSGHYQIGDEEMNLDALLKLLRENPENVSPNVVLRPLFQEFIFPNLAYIGGGGELAYWMERKSMFEAFNVPFPMLIRRDSFMLVDRRSMNNLELLGLPVTELFDREEQIINRYALQQAATEINLDGSKKKLKDLFSEIAELSKAVDPTLFKSVMGECAKAEKIIEYLESKLLKAEKRNRTTELRKISNLKGKFFPGNDGLQERYDNFIPYFLRYGPSWIETMIQLADPLNKSFKILIENGNQSK